MKINSKGRIRIAFTDMEADFYTTDSDLSVLKAVEDGRLHVSISHPGRLPSWDEIRDIRYSLCPDDVYMAIILPPKAEYVNLHNFCMHLFEIER